MNTRRIYDVDTLYVGSTIFTVLTKAVKNLSMRCAVDGLLTITCPIGTPWSEVEEFARKNLEWAEKTQYNMMNRQHEPEKPYGPQERHAFMARVQKIFPKCEARMKLYASKVTVRLMKTQWGSCNHRTRSISLNLALARRDDECLEYVIIHELAHIVHPDHSDRFWTLVEAHCPDWRRIRTSMRKL